MANPVQTQKTVEPICRIIQTLILGPDPIKAGRISNCTSAQTAALVQFDLGLQPAELP